MRYANLICLLSFAALAATGCSSAQPTRGRNRQLAPDREVSEPRVPLKDSLRTRN